MSEMREKSNRPDNGAMSPWFYQLGLRFHPHIKLEKKKGLEFFQQLADTVDPQSLQLKDESWTVSQPLGANPNGSLDITLTPSGIHMRGNFPTHSKEWFEHRYHEVLAQIEKRFKPKLILESSATLCVTMGVDGDARRFLAEHVMKLPGPRIQSLGRPVHLVGLRLFFPPYMVSKKTKSGKPSQKQNVTEWHVDLKVESLMEDPTKLYLLVEAHWPTPRQWNSQALLEAEGRLQTVSTYLEKNVVAFLTQDALESGA